MINPDPPPVSASTPASVPGSTVAPGRSQRLLMAGTAVAAVTATDLLVKAWAQDALATRSQSLGPLELRLGFNPGVAFSLGDRLPGWAVLALTGALTGTVLVAIVVATRRRGVFLPVALSLLAGGALGNVVDRWDDALVTDYLHSGWWPTFNLADVFICLGAGMTFLWCLRPNRSRQGSDVD